MFYVLCLIFAVAMSCVSSKLYTQKESLVKFDKTIQTSVNYLSTIDSVAKVLRTSQEKLKEALDSVDIDFNDKLKLIRSNDVAMKQLDIAILSLYIPEYIMKRVIKEKIEKIIKEE